MGAAIVLDQPLQSHRKGQKNCPDSTIVVEAIPLETS